MQKYDNGKEENRDGILDLQVVDLTIMQALSAIGTAMMRDL